jgi:hypothetical protein
MLVTTYKTTRCHKTEDHDQNLHRREKLKSQLPNIIQDLELPSCYENGHEPSGSIKDGERTTVFYRRPLFHEISLVTAAVTKLLASE